MSLHCPIDLSTDCTAVVLVESLPGCDVEMYDGHYLRKMMKKALKNQKLDPCILIKTLYANTYVHVARILERNEQHCKSMVTAAQTAIDLEIAEADFKTLPITLSVAELLEKLNFSKRWDNTDLLERVVSSLPVGAGKLAMSLLERYNTYLDVYDEAVSLIDSLEWEPAAPEETKALLPVEVTLAKDLTEFNRKDCKEMLALLLCMVLKIPRSKITVIDARSGDSTTVVCLIDEIFMLNIIQCPVKANVLWAFQELSVTRMRIGMFEVNVSQLQHFKDALRSGLTGDMDFVAATKVSGTCELIVLMFAALCFTVQDINVQSCSAATINFPDHDSA